MREIREFVKVICGIFGTSRANSISTTFEILNSCKEENLSKILVGKVPFAELMFLENEAMKKMKKTG